jgi:hypothetical protein
VPASPREALRVSVPLEESLDDVLVQITQCSAFPAEPLTELGDHLDLNASRPWCIALAANKVEVSIQMIGERPHSGTGNAIQYNKRFFHPPSMAARGAVYAESQTPTKASVGTLRLPFGIVRDSA